jgi:CheY-like chemotaxis protein
MPTLLVADDSVTIQRVIELTFADEDVQVVAVGDGDQAIAQLDSPAPPDIVLADIGMPGKSGYDVAHHVKKTPRLAHIPVVLLTGAFEPIDRNRAALVGCDGVLAKPFEPQLVIARVKELLDRRAVPPATGAATAADRRTDLDEYFDQLDAAFANLATTGPARKTPALAPLDPPAVPVSYASPLTEFEHDTRSVKTEPAVLPSIGDAFAALLAAEQTDLTAALSTWPAPAPSPLDDQALDRIARRVVEQLSDRVVREAVGEIVSATAERLVREEIDKLKATIK